MHNCGTANRTANRTATVRERLTGKGLAQAVLGEFWRTLPEVLDGRTPAEAEYLSFGPIQGALERSRARRMVHGTNLPRTLKIRLVGGCLAVLAAATGGYIGRRLRPGGSSMGSAGKGGAGEGGKRSGAGGRPWLFLEDIKETPYRIDRHLASLKHAGWFDRIGGLLLGDFHATNNDTQPATLELLRYHLPPHRDVPVVTTRSIGHVWPMAPVLVNRPVRMEVHGREVTIWAWPGGGDPGAGGQ